MAITRYTKACQAEKRGFALLVAVIFMSVMLVFGLALGSLAFKQQSLVSTSLQSQFAFYAADSGLECALYADQQELLFSYPATETSAPILSCDGQAAIQPISEVYSATQWVVKNRLSLGGGKYCADVTVYKPNPAAGVATTSIFSQGYNEPCSRISTPDSHLSVRGLEAYYQ
jgi:hypothetical protein